MFSYVLNFILYPFGTKPTFSGTKSRWPLEAQAEAELEVEVGEGDGGEAGGEEEAVPEGGRAGFGGRAAPTAVGDAGPAPVDILPVKIALAVAGSEVKTCPAGIQPVEAERQPECTGRYSEMPNRLFTVGVNAAAVRNRAVGQTVIGSLLIPAG